MQPSGWQRTLNIQLQVNIHAGKLHKVLPSFSGLVDETTTKNQQDDDLCTNYLDCKRQVWQQGIILTAEETLKKEEEKKAPKKLTDPPEDWMRTLSSLMSSTSPADAISDTPPAPAISTLLFSEVTLSGPKQEMEVITCLSSFLSWCWPCFGVWVWTHLPPATAELVGSCKNWSHLN